jgi:hypothetical protein
LIPNGRLGVRPHLDDHDRATVELSMIDLHVRARKNVAPKGPVRKLLLIVVGVADSPAASVIFQPHQDDPHP